MTHSPDVGIILEQLRNEIRAQRVAAGAFEQSPVEQELRRSLEEIELHRVVSAHWPLKGRSLPERAINLVNKLVRRFLRWYINPIVEQQNAFNDSVARSVRLLAEAYTELREEIRTTQVVPPAQVPPPDAGATPIPTDQPALQRLVEQRGQAEPPAHFIELALQAQLPELSQRSTVSAHWPINGSTMAGRAAALTQRSVRQYLRWLINPIVEQQNAANAAMAGAIINTTRLDAERRAEVAAYRARNARG